MKKIWEKLKKPYSAFAIISSMPQLSPVKNRSITDIIGNVANFILWIAGIIAFIYLVYGGILYMTAGGNPEKAKVAKDAVFHAIIGIAVILVIFTIVNLIKKIIGEPTPPTW